MIEMYMIELETVCKCGSKELSTHQQESEPAVDEMQDVIYGYCSECGREFNGLIKDCTIRKPSTIK